MIAPITDPAHRPAPLPEFLGFASQPHEIKVDRLPVTGVIPEWLSGSLVRNGPAKFEVGDYRLTHWFNGLAMLHAFTFRGGEVSYTNRYLRTKAYEQATQAQRLYGKQFGTDPCPTLFGRHFTAYSPLETDNCNVNIARIADRFIAMVEQPVAVEFDPRTLETLGQYRMDTAVPGHIISPHPHVDFERRALVDYVTVVGPGSSSYQVFTIDEATGEQRQLASVPTDRPCYMHSFAMTPNYVVLVEFPVVIDPEEFLQANRSWVDSFRWTPDRGTRFLVVDKRDGRLVRTVESDSFFAFHHINASESNGELLIDIAAAQSPHGTVLGLPPEPGQPDLSGPGYSVRRYRVPLRHGGTAEFEPLADFGVEMPRINYRLSNGKSYRYAYGLSPSPRSGALSRIAKIDTQAGDHRIWRESGCFPGEPVFVPRPDPDAEDDGVVLSGVLDAKSGVSFLLVLDGSSFEELGRATLPQHIPSDLHGEFFHL